MKSNYFLKGKMWVGMIVVGSSFLLASCDNNDGSSNTPPVPPTPNKPVTITTPKSKAECDAKDIAGLDSLSKLNPKLNLFKSDNPDMWTTIHIGWGKDATTGKFVVQSLSIAKDSVLMDQLHLVMTATTFPHLRKIDVQTDKLVEVNISQLPQLDSVHLDGLSKSPLSSIKFYLNPKLKVVSLENFSQLKGDDNFQIRGGNLDKISLNNIPNLDDIIRVSPPYGSDDIMTLKTFEVSGDMKSLYQIKLDGLALEQFVNNCKELPSLYTLSVQTGKLSGNLNLENLPSLYLVSVPNNNISSITIKNCPSLNELDIHGNKGLNQWTFSQIDRFKHFSFYEVNMPVVDLTAYTHLNSIDGHNTGMTKLSLPVKYSSSVYNQMFNFSQNKFTSFDYPASTFKDVYGLILDDNQITTLNLQNLKKLKRILINNNALVNLTLPDEQNGTLKEFEFKNNHLSLDIIKMIKSKYTKFSFFKYSPQTVLTGVDQQNKTINVSDLQQKGYSITAQKLQGTTWVDASSDEFSKTDNGVFTFTKPGTYRIAITQINDFDQFTKSEPYAVGNLLVK